MMLYWQSVLHADFYHGLHFEERADQSLVTLSSVRTRVSLETLLEQIRLPVIEIQNHLAEEAICPREPAVVSEFGLHLLAT